MTPQQKIKQLLSHAESHTTRQHDVAVSWQHWPGPRCSAPIIVAARWLWLMDSLDCKYYCIAEASQRMDGGPSWPGRFRRHAGAPQR